MCFYSEKKIVYPIASVQYPAGITKLIICIVIVNPLTIYMEFSSEYIIIENTENIPLNLEPKQNALFQALRVQWNLDIP